MVHTQALVKAEERGGFKEERKGAEGERRTMGHAFWKNCGWRLYHTCPACRVAKMEGWDNFEDLQDWRKKRGLGGVLFCITGPLQTECVSVELEGEVVYCYVCLCFSPISSEK